MPRQIFLTSPMCLQLFQLPTIKYTIDIGKSSNAIQLLCISHELPFALCICPDILSHQ